MEPPVLPTEEAANGSIEQIRSGQKIVIYAILIRLVSFPLRFLPELAPLAGLIALIVICISAVGIFHLATGLKYHWILRVLFCVAMIVPILSIVLLLILNSKATAALRASGYKVGLMGAAKKESASTASVHFSTGC